MTISLEKSHTGLLATAGSLACLVLLGGTAASPVGAAFGNTIVSTYPDGRTGELYLQKDGAYTAKGRRGDGSSGHWKVNGDKLCLNQSRPFPSPFGFCTPIPKGGLGQTWSAKAVTGEAVRVKLVKGRFEGHPREAGGGVAEKPDTASQQN